MPNQTLTEVMKASLALEEGRTSDAKNPLDEADPDSLDELFDRVNAKLVAGMPETITDEDILPVVRALRAQRLKFIQKEETAKPRKRSVAGASNPKTPPKVETVDLDI